MDTKFAEQFLERVYAALHAADDDLLYVEFIRLLNDFGEKEKTPDSVPQVYSFSHFHQNLTSVNVHGIKHLVFKHLIIAVCFCVLVNTAKCVGLLHVMLYVSVR